MKKVQTHSKSIGLGGQQHEQLKIKTLRTRISHDHLDSRGSRSHMIHFPDCILAIAQALHQATQPEATVITGSISLNA